MAARVSVQPRTAEQAARDILKANGHPGARVVRVNAAGDTCDGRGEEILFVGCDGRARVARCRLAAAGPVVTVTDGW